MFTTMQQTTNKTKRFGTAIIYIIMCMMAIMPCAAQNDCKKDEAAECREERRRSKPKMSPKEFIQRYKQYIIREAGMTEEEAQKFFPIYDAQKNQLRELYGKIGRASVRIYKEDLAEKDCERILSEVIKLKEQAAEMEAEACKKWRSCLPASKIIKVLNAERRFGKDFLHGRKNKDAKR